MVKHSQKLQEYGRGVDFVYNLTADGEFEYAADAIAYFIFGSTCTDNMFYCSNFYKMGVVDTYVKVSRLYIDASALLLRVEESICAAIYGRDKEYTLDIMKDLQWKLEEVISG